MALFGLGKKKEEKSCGYSVKVTPVKKQPSNCGGSTERVSIKVLGSGCKNCHTLFENTKTAVENMNLKANVEYITDMQKVMSYGAMSMPVLVVNEKIESMGKVLKSSDIEKLLKGLGF